MTVNLSKPVENHIESNYLSETSSLQRTELLYCITRTGRQMQSFFSYYLEGYGGKLLSLCNLKQKDASELKIKDPFLKDIVEYWSCLNYSEKNPVNNSINTSQTIWLQATMGPYRRFRTG